MKLFDFGDGQQVVQCPTCGIESVHPIQVRVFPIQGVAECVIDSQGIKTHASNAANKQIDGGVLQRGASIVVRFVCENESHVFETEFRFHKGNTFVETTELSNAPAGDTIWRS